MKAATAEQIRSIIEARLQELQPALAEVEELRDLLTTLAPQQETPQQANRSVASLSSRIARGEPTSSGVALAPVTQLRPPARLGSKRGRDGRAPQGANKQRILATIAEHPGIAAPQIAKLTGLGRPLVASTISRLKRTGELQSLGRGVGLAGMRTVQADEEAAAGSRV